MNDSSLDKVRRRVLLSVVMLLVLFTVFNLSDSFISIPFVSGLGSPTNNMTIAVDDFNGWNMRYFLEYNYSSGKVDNIFNTSYISNNNYAFNADAQLLFSVDNKVYILGLEDGNPLNLTSWVYDMDSNTISHLSDIVLFVNTIVQYEWQYDRDNDVAHIVFKDTGYDTRYINITDFSTSFTISTAYFVAAGGVSQEDLDLYLDFNASKLWIITWHDNDQVTIISRALSGGAYLSNTIDTGDANYGYSAISRFSGDGKIYLFSRKSNATPSLVNIIIMEINEADNSFISARAYDPTNDGLGLYFKVLDGKNPVSGERNLFIIGKSSGSEKIPFVAYSNDVWVLDQNVIEANYAGWAVDGVTGYLDSNGVPRMVYSKRFSQANPAIYDINYTDLDSPDLTPYILKNTYLDWAVYSETYPSYTSPSVNIGAPTPDAVSIISAWDGYALYRDKSDWNKMWVLVGDVDGYDTITHVYLRFHLGEPEPIDPNYAWTYDVSARRWSPDHYGWGPFYVSNEYDDTFWNGYPGTNQIGVPFVFRIDPGCPITWNVNITGGGYDSSGNYTNGPPSYSGYTSYTYPPFHILDSGAPPPGSSGGEPVEPGDDEPEPGPGDPGYVPPEWDDVYNCTLTYDEKVTLYNELRYMTIRELRELCLEMGLDHQDWTTKEPYILLIFVDGYGCQPPDGVDRDPDDVDDDGLLDDEEVDPWDPLDTRQLGPEIFPGGGLLPRVFNFTWIQTNSSWILVLLFLLLLLMWLSRETKEKDLIDIFKPLRDLQ